MLYMNLENLYQTLNRYQTDRLFLFFKILRIPPVLVSTIVPEIFLRPKIIKNFRENVCTFFAIRSLKTSVLFFANRFTRKNLKLMIIQFIIICHDGVKNNLLSCNADFFFLMDSYVSYVVRKVLIKCTNYTNVFFYLSINRVVSFHGLG